MEGQASLQHCSDTCRSAQLQDHILGKEGTFGHTHIFQSDRDAYLVGAQAGNKFSFPYYYTL